MGWPGAYVKKKHGAIPTARMAMAHLSALKAEERVVLNELRKAEGLPSRKAHTKWVGAVEVQSKPDICTVTELKDCGDFVRLNLNGGDSWAYWHPKENFELIHDFKSDTYYLTKELVPDYYKELYEERLALTSTPTDDGDLILAFRDYYTAKYYNGLWNPSTQKLSYSEARNETQLHDWMKSHGRMMGDHIPVWFMGYHPREDFIIDEKTHRINTFLPSKYMLCEAVTGKFDNILSVIYHMLGAQKGVEEDDRLVAHFINWFAAVYQRQIKPLTAWVCHGIEGTGKGYFINKIAAPLLGKNNWISATINNVEDEYNGWIENRLLVFIDEVDVDDFREKGRITARLRNYITEPTITSRRMRQTALAVMNYASFIFSSNRPQPAYIPETDRRYNVGNFQSRRLAPPNDEAVEDELIAFATYLNTFAVDVKAANMILNTEARQKIANLSINSLELTCRHIKSGNFEALWMAMPDEKALDMLQVKSSHNDDARAYLMLMKDLARRVVEDSHMRLSSDELYVILQHNVGNISPKVTKFNTLLRHHGIELKRLRRDGYRINGIESDWDISEEFRQELIEYLGGAKTARLRKVK